MNDINKNEKIEKAKRYSTIYYIVEPVLFIGGIASLFIFRGWYYMIALFGMVICYALLGVRVTDIMNDYAKLAYPQCFSASGRADRAKIKRAAKENNDDVTLTLIRRQTTMFILCVCYVVLLVLFASSVL